MLSVCLRFGRIVIVRAYGHASSLGGKVPRSLPVLAEAGDQCPDGSITTGGSAAFHAIFSAHGRFGNWAGWRVQGLAGLHPRPTRKWLAGEQMRIRNDANRASDVNETDCG